MCSIDTSMSKSIFTLNNVVILNLCLWSTSASLAFAAGEIDSHRVVGSGLFGEQVADSGYAPLPNDVPVVRDQYGALWDASSASNTVSSSSSIGSSSMNSINNASPAHITAGTAGYYSPLNSWTGSESSPTQQAYAGGYGQYGPTNNLDLLRAGLTTDLRPLGGVFGSNLLGQAGNYSNLLFPDRNIPSPIVSSPNGIGDRHPAGAALAQSNTQKNSVPVTAARPAPTNMLTPTNMLNGMQTGMPVRMHNVQTKSQTKSQPETQARALAKTRPLTISDIIGGVTGSIIYADGELVIFGRRGTLRETPDQLTSVTLPNGRMFLLENADRTVHQIAALSKQAI